MRKTFTLFILALACRFGFAAGGPDAYGYTWAASTDAGGPTYQWIDISTTGTIVPGLADDNSAVQMVNIGFPFHYYWSDYTQVKVGSNGWVSFNNVSNIASCFPTIPTAGGAGDNILAALMGDLNFTGAGNPGQVFTWTNFQDSFIVMFKNVPFWMAAAPSWTGSNNFEIILNGADSSITYMYQTTGGFQNNAGCVDLTVGIENSTGSIGLQVWSDLLPPANYAIRFDYPSVVLLAVRDLTPLWNMNTVNGGKFIPSGLFQMITDVKNVGNTAVTSAITVTGAIKNLALATVSSGTLTLPSLAAGDDSLIVFSTIPNITTTGSYYFETNTSNGTDINAANNQLRTEVGIVDLCQANVTLGYTTGTTATGSLNWNGGAIDDGAGVYMEPPVYPATISTISYFVSSTSGVNGFEARLNDDNGGLGVAGTLLFSAQIPAGSVTSGTWVNVPVNPPVTITSGGFYVSWFQGGTTIFFGTENTGPISRRSYEILDNAWSSYRDNTTQDLMIRATMTGHPQSPPASFSHVVTANSVAFTNLTLGGTSYSWDFGDSQTSTAFSPTHTYANPGYYVVCLTAASACTSNTVCDTVYICGDPEADFSASNIGLNVFFNDSSLNFPSTYYWEFGDGSTDTVANPVHAYPAPGLYTSCLIVTNLCGNDTTCYEVPLCDPPVAGMNVANGGSAVFFTFDDNSTTTSSIVSYLWDFGDGVFSPVPNATHSYPGCGTYMVCLTVTDTCGNVDSICQPLTIDIPPVAMYSTTQNSLDVNATDLSTGNGLTSWEWSWGDGSPNSTTQNASHTYGADGTFTICLTVTDTCGSDDTCMTVTLLARPDAMFDAFSVHPNPSTGEFIVEGLTNSSFEAAISVSDVTGRVVWTSATENYAGAFSRRIDLRGMPAGMYLGTIVSGDRKATFRLLVE